MSLFNCRVWGAVYNEKGEILMARRNAALYPNSTEYIGWEFCGGGIEPGEMPEQALIREYKEELGVDIGTPKLLNARTSERDGKPLLVLFYSAPYLGGEVRLTNEQNILEHDTYQWFSRAELAVLNMGVHGNEDRDAFLLP